MNEGPEKREVNSYKMTRAKTSFKKIFRENKRR